MLWKNGLLFVVCISSKFEEKLCIECWISFKIELMPFYVLKLILSLGQDLSSKSSQMDTNLEICDPKMAKTSFDFTKSRWKVIRMMINRHKFQHYKKRFFLKALNLGEKGERSQGSNFSTKRKQEFKSRFKWVKKVRTLTIDLGD